MLQVPYAFDLLAQRLVLWRDGEGQWRCFEDRRAPHSLPRSSPAGSSNGAGDTARCAQDLAFP